jgi:hypothetical protein
VKVMFLFWCLFCAPRIMFLCTFVAETFIRHNNLIWSRFTWQGRWRLRPSMWCWSWRHCRHSCDSLSCCCWCPLRPAALALFDCTVSSWRSLFLSLSLEYSIFSLDCSAYVCRYWGSWTNILFCLLPCCAVKVMGIIDYLLCLISYAEIDWNTCLSLAEIGVLCWASIYLITW